MAFSDLCHISNAYKAVENEVDQVSKTVSVVKSAFSHGCCKCPIGAVNLTHNPGKPYKYLLYSCIVIEM